MQGFKSMGDAERMEGYKKVRQHMHDHGVATELACRAMGTALSTYYGWRKLYLQQNNNVEFIPDTAVAPKQAEKKPEKKAIERHTETIVIQSAPPPAKKKMNNLVVVMGDTKEMAEFLRGVFDGE